MKEKNLLIEQINVEVPESILSEKPALEIVRELERTQLNFCPNLSLEQIWEQEKEYYKQHGMGAFDCGYARRKLALNEIDQDEKFQIG